jgi:hypothetical protein
MYTSEFFYSGKWVSKNIPRAYHITDDMIQRIKSLKAHHSDESGYYDNMLQWRLEDNEYLTKKELNDIYPAMQFITISCQLKPDFIQKYNVEDWQIGLLKQLYLDWDEDDTYITMEFKRPFGNSNILGDVRKEMVNQGVQAAIDRDNMLQWHLEDNYNDYVEEQLALNQFVDMLEKLFTEVGYYLPVTAFQQTELGGPFSYNGPQWTKYVDKRFRIHSYLYDWQPDISQYRDEKLNQILS